MRRPRVESPDCYTWRGSSSPLAPPLCTMAMASVVAAIQRHALSLIAVCVSLPEVARAGVAVL